MADGVAPESPDLDASLRAGVEILDPNPTWLDQRLFHYDVLMRGARLPESLTTALARTQPQARVVPLARLLGAPPGFAGTAGAGRRGNRAATPVDRGRRGVG
jgi:hypothetical protein